MQGFQILPPLWVFVVFALLVAVAGWAVIEALLWVAHHISIGWSWS
jgi:hypothetical protein